MILNSTSNIQQPVLENIMNLEPPSQQNQSQEKLGLTSTDWNSEANSVKGKAFENLVFNDLVSKNYINIIEGCGPRNKREHPTVIRNAEGLRICSCDFVAERDGIVEYIEAKGGYTNYTNTWGKQTAGARRCDSVKKALWNGTRFKKYVPNSRYVIYFSQEPRPGTISDLNIKDALEDNIVDEVRYLHFYETID